MGKIKKTPNLWNILSSGNNISPVFEPFQAYSQGDFLNSISTSRVFIDTQSVAAISLPLSSLITVLEILVRMRGHKME